MRHVMSGVIVFGLAFAVMLLIGGADETLAGNGKGPGDGTGIGPCTCGQLLDADPVDGICDVCGGCIPKGDGPKGPKAPKAPKDGCRRPAANGNGPGDGTGVGTCSCGALLDVDPVDGVCDVCGGCIPKGDGPKGPKTKRGK